MYHRYSTLSPFQVEEIQTTTSTSLPPRMELP